MPGCINANYPAVSPCRRQPRSAISNSSERNTRGRTRCRAPPNMETSNEPGKAGAVVMKGCCK
eukprot:7547574-Lingulodinium_polyedra.AAC.1